MTRNAPEAPGLQALLASPSYGILRLGQASGRPFWRVKLIRDGKRHTRSFADAKYGGTQAAHAAARACRDALLRQLGPAGRTTPRWQPTPGYTTGVRGVLLKRYKGSYFATAQTQFPDGAIRKQAFSIDKYGEPSARRMAIAARKAQLRERDAYRKAHPTPPRQFTPKPMHPPNMYGILRVEGKRRGTSVHGGMWDVMIRRNKVRYSRSFADAAHGGKAAALRKAQAFRDRIIRTVPPTPKRVRNQQLISTNTSGVAGVRRHVNHGPKQGPEGYAVYVARTQLPDGRVVTRSFGIPKYGEAEAFALAVAARQRQLQQVDGYRVHSPGALPSEAARHSVQASRAVEVSAP